MEGRLLVSTHISTLFSPSQLSATPIQTRHKNTPLPEPPSSSSLQTEHASFSNVSHAPEIGTVLLRVLHDGLILELASLSSDAIPLRFAFPARILPVPAAFLWKEREIHILAVTVLGSLYRIVVPVGTRYQLWSGHGNSPWYTEYQINHLVVNTPVIVHAQGAHCVVIGMNNGSLLRIEADQFDLGHDDRWIEFVSNQTSFFLSLSSFLPHKNAAPPEASEFVAIATYPWPSDIGHVWTLSRDRTVKLWKAKIGCVASKMLASYISREATPSPGRSSATPSTHVLLESGRKNWLRVFPGEDDKTYLLAFIPGFSFSSAGTFHLLRSEGDQLVTVGSIDCSPDNATSHLQDFVISGNQLSLLWDRRGQSVVEVGMLDIDEIEQGQKIIQWQTALYPEGPEYTPAFLESLLLSPGSLVEKFLEAILVPGVFSPLSLRIALSQYTDACLSLPGVPPPQLTRQYSTLQENITAVVGSTINLIPDPQTGALQYAKYWIALKRDWEGFIARCREVERSARWPLALGVDEQNELIVVERERVGSCVPEDLSLCLLRRLETESQVDQQYDMLNILWTLRGKLGPPVMLGLESRVTDILHQETAFSLADILRDQTDKSNLQEGLDEGLRSWISGRLQSIDNVHQSVHTIIDVIGGFDMEVKREEDEVELLLPPTRSNWQTSLTAAYVAASVIARYELSLCLILFVFFSSEDLEDWDPNLLAEMFAVFRGVAMLRTAARRPVGESKGSQHSEHLSSDIADDVVSRLRNMQMSEGSSVTCPHRSLIHRILNDFSDVANLPVSAHRFLDSTGLLRSIMPSHATRYEVSFCDKLFLLGYHEITMEMLGWLPRTPGVIYILARLWLSVGRADDAALFLEKLAGCFGESSGASPEDQEALALILPNAEPFPSDFAFYIFASALFKNASFIDHEVSFCKLAISVAPPDADTMALWHNVIKGYIELGLYKDAYASLMSTPYVNQKKDFVTQLVYRMCEEDAVEQFMTFNFVGFVDDVEECLSFKARNADPRTRPFYSRILYTWYIQKGDYRNAAATMYQRARKLHELIGDPTTVMSLAQEQLEAYLIAINSLMLLDRKSAWVITPAFDETGQEPSKRRKLSRHIPDSGYGSGKYDSEIVDLTDMQFEYALLSARVELVRQNPGMLASGEFWLPPTSIILRLAQSNKFDTALALAGSLNVDMTDMFAHLTAQCLRLSQNEELILQQDTSDWLLTDKTLSWPGTSADRGWRYLRHALNRHDKAETDYSYSKATLETILCYDRTNPAPPWLISFLEEHHHDYLIRTSLRYELFESAIEHSLAMIRKDDARLVNEPPKHDSATWLPYSLMDQVLVVTATQEDLSERGKSLRQQLKTEIAGRIKRMQKLSQSLS